MKSILFSFLAFLGFQFASSSFAIEIYVVGEPSNTFTTNNSTSPYGKALGADVDFFEEILGNLGYNVKMDVLPWSRAYQTALNKPNVMLIGISKTPEREPLFHWVEVYQNLTYYFVQLSTKEPLNIKRIGDAKPLRIGVLQDDIRHQYLLKKGFRNLIPSANYETLFSLLLKDRIDLIPISNEPFSLYCAPKYNCDEFSRIYDIQELNGILYLAFGKNTDIDIVKTIRKAYQESVLNGTYRAKIRDEDVKLEFLESFHK